MTLASRQRITWQTGEEEEQEEEEEEIPDQINSSGLLRDKSQCFTPTDLKRAAHTGRFSDEQVNC